MCGKKLRGKESVCRCTKQGRNTRKGKKLEVCHFCGFLHNPRQMSGTATLLIETSTPQGSIGLFDGKWHEETFLSERSHNCDIFAPLTKITAGLVPGDIGAIIVGTGPGSYSGSRVGIAVGQGLAIAHNCPLIGLPSFLATVPARELSRCVAIGDARRGDWWWAEITAGNSSGDPAMGGLEEMRTMIANGEPGVFSLDEIDAATFTRTIARETPSAGRLWQCWCALDEQEKSFHASRPVQPVYLKPPHVTTAKSGHPLQRGR
jgi:tRNA threonylcarbamoyladenosine biosynthesis protein TsaB